MVAVPTGDIRVIEERRVPCALGKCAPAERRACGQNRARLHLQAFLRAADQPVSVLRVPAVAGFGRIEAKLVARRRDSIIPVRVDHLQGNLHIPGKETQVGHIDIRQSDSRQSLRHYPLNARLGDDDAARSTVGPRVAWAETSRKALACEAMPVAKSAFSSCSWLRRRDFRFQRDDAPHRAFRRLLKDRAERIDRDRATAPVPLASRNSGAAGSDSSGVGSNAGSGSIRSRQAQAPRLRAAPPPFDRLDLLDDDLRHCALRHCALRFDDDRLHRQRVTVP